MSSLEVVEGEVARTTNTTTDHGNSQPRWLATAALVGLVFAAAGFIVVDQAYYRFANGRFPVVGDSAALATLWGLVSRAHVIIPVLVVCLWRPRFVGLQIGRSLSRWRMLTGVLIAICSVVAAFVLLAHATPYSGNQWLLTEAVTVPLVEELMWRGIVLSSVLLLLEKAGVGRAAPIAVWSTGIVFGALHLGNALAGVPVAFVIPQVAAAVAAGVAFGYARMATDSVYPPIVLHAAMNLTVVLLS
jgi:membrane protease YdiL (CAAX protease family)